MTTVIDDLVVRVDADTTRLRAELADVGRLSQRFGDSLGRALEDAALRGKGLSDVLRGVADSLSRAALDMAMKPLESLAAGAFQTLLSGILPGAQVPVTPFAKGGVVASPSFFSLSQGLGVAGEAGAEAILPLARGADGRLGVRSGA